MRNKILHIIFSLTTGGSENLLVDLVNNQSESNDVHLIIINNRYNLNLLNRIDGRVKKYLINRKEGSKNLLKICRVNALFSAIKPDIIHCHNHDVINLMVHYRKKTLLTVHALTENASDIAKYRKVVAISEAVRKDVEARANDAIDIDVVYNAIDFEKIAVKENFKPGKKIRLVQVGRLMHEVKGQDILIEAVKILIDKGLQNIEADLIGDGESKTYLEALISKHHLQNHVSIVSGKDRGWLYPNLKNYDILVQPSRMEGFGLTVIEGIAAGIPVIASDLHGPKEILAEGKYGELFESENANDLAEKISLVINKYQRSELKQKADEAYKYAKSQFSMKKMVDDYACIYDRLSAVSKKKLIK